VIRRKRGAWLQLQIEGERHSGRCGFQLAFVKAEESGEETATGGGQAAKFEFTRTAGDGGETVGAAFGGNGGAGQGLRAGTDDALLDLSSVKRQRN
jgi:hypothetical protein